MDVNEGGLAVNDGILPGDLIQLVNGKLVKTAAQMIEYLRSIPAEKDIVIGIIRMQQLTAVIVCGGVEPPNGLQK